MTPTPNFSSTRPTTAVSPDPYEIIPSKWGNLPRWHVNANLTGEMKDYERVRNDAINAQSMLEDLLSREKALAAEKMSFSAEKAKFKADAEKFGAGASALMGRIAVEQDRLEKIRADQEEPLALPPGHKSEEPEPRQALEDAAPGEPSEDPTKEDQEGDPHGEFPRLTKPIAMDQTEFPNPQLPHPPEIQPQVGAGLDHGAV